MSYQEHEMTEEEWASFIKRIKQPDSPELKAEEFSLKQYDEIRKGFEKTIMPVLKGEQNNEYIGGMYKVKTYRIDKQDLIRIDIRPVKK